MNPFKSYSIILFTACFLIGCMQETPSLESTPSKPTTKKTVLQTTIQGLDLSKPQSSEYFRGHLVPAREFVAWCDKTMIEPIPKDKTSQMFHGNCKEAGFAIMMGAGNLEKRWTHKSY